MGTAAERLVPMEEEGRLLHKLTSESRLVNCHVSAVAVGGGLCAKESFGRRRPAPAALIFGGYGLSLSLHTEKFPACWL